MKPSPQAHEEARLAALSHLNPQHQSPDKGFDDITLLASKICGSPMAAMTLVGRDQIWIASKIGLEINSIPRDHSFCDYTITQTELFEVPDTHADERFSANPVVTQRNGVRHYAGVPVLSPDGYPVGSLCVMDFHPKKLNDHQIELLGNLGRQASERLQLQSMHRTVACQNKFEQSILAIAPAGVIVTDLNGLVTHYNAAAEQILGYSAKEIVGTVHYSDLQLPVGKQKRTGDVKGNNGADAALSSSNASDESSLMDKIVHCEGTCRSKSGDLIEINLSTIPVRDDEHTLSGYLHVIKDLSDAKETEAQIRESEARLRDLFHHTSDLIQVVDQQGRIVFTNRSWRKTLGYTGEEAEAMHMFDLIHPDCHGHCQLAFESLMNGKDVGLIEAQFVTKDGRTLDVEGDLSVRTENGVPVSTRGIFRDVTARKKAEAFQRQQTRLLQFQAATAKVIAGSVDLKESLQTCAEIVANHFDCVLAGIWRVEEGGSLLILQACAGACHDGCKSYQQVAIGSDPIGMIAKDQLPLLTNQLLESTRFECGDWIHNESITSLAGLPLIAENRLVGVLAVLSKNDLPPDTLVALSSISNGLALSIQGHEKKEALKHSEARHRMLIQNSRDAMVTLHPPDWKFRSCNPAALKLFGASSEEEFNQLGPWDVSPLKQPCGGASSELAVNCIKKALKEGSNYFEWTHQRSDGTTFPSTVLLSRMDFKEAPFVLATVRDITQQKNTETDLIETNRQLIKANKSKSEFLSRMSHELRTPLNGILGFSKLLEMDKLTERQLKNATRIHDSGQHLLKLINEVLDLSRIEADRLDLHMDQVDIANLIREVVDMIHPMIRERQIDVQLDFGGDQSFLVCADRQRLFQVVLNLASNGVKYNKEGGCLRFRLSYPHANLVELSVTDEGAGISADAYERVFEPFERLESSQKEEKIEGTGLGMALSKKLIEAMHGTIRLESELGQGATFTVALPAATSHSLPSPEKNAHDFTTEGSSAEEATYQVSLKVLYIEDNADNLMLVEQVVQLRQHVELISASDGKKGLEMAKQLAPDLILLDFHLPVLNGDIVLSELKNDPRTADVPVYMLSADAMPVHIEKLKSQGAIDYITKPLDIKHFLSVLDKETQQKQTAQ